MVVSDDDHTFNSILLSRTQGGTLLFYEDLYSVLTSYLTEC